MTAILLGSCAPGEVRVALMRDAVLAEYAIWRPGAPDGVGDLHRGRVTARLPALAGCFVALAEGEGFLPDSESGNPTVGDAVAVRVTRAAQNGKGPRLTARLDEAARALAGSGPPALIRRGPSPIERLARLHPGAEIRLDDPGVAASLRPVLGDRIGRVTRAFDDAVEDQVEALAEPGVALPGGARATIHPTPALVAIDVDAGAASGERQARAGLHLAVNRHALPELARQIRLRNLSGAILIDFAGLSPKRRAGLGPELAAALAGDTLPARLLGFTALGLAEIVRPRIHPPLHELLAGPHAAGLRALRRLAAEPVGPRAPVLRASPAIVSALQADRDALAGLADRLGRDLILRTDPALPPQGWTLQETDP